MTTHEIHLNIRNTFRNKQVFQVIATCESRKTNACHTLWNDYMSEGITVLECESLYLFDFLRKSGVLHNKAFTECAVAK